MLTSIINLSLVSRILVMIQKHRGEVIDGTAEAVALTDIVDPVHTESYLGRITGGIVGDGWNEGSNGGWLLHCTRIRLSSVSPSIYSARLISLTGRTATCHQPCTGTESPIHASLS
jgi:hypothetical protein